MACVTHISNLHRREKMTENAPVNLYSRRWRKHSSLVVYSLLPLYLIQRAQYSCYAYGPGKASQRSNAYGWTCFSGTGQHFTFIREFLSSSFDLVQLFPQGISIPVIF